jgi:hypothetical protein
MTFKIRAEKYRALMEMSRKSGVESLKFFKNPSLLECRFCPCHESKMDACSRKIDETCASAFYRFVFMEE